METKYKTHRILEFVLLVIVLASIFAGNSRADENTKYLEAVREFADNVLEHGRDKYGPKHTPLFVDGLNVHTHEPVKWRSRGQVWILSNLASQQNLFRTLDGLTKITGDTKYKQAAMDAIKYAFENLRSSNGLLYWGNWLAYDAQTEDICKLYNGHILKHNYPYYELMWKVNPKATEQFIESFWSAHIVDWSNMDMNRIGSITEQLEKAWEYNYEGGPVFFESKLPHGLSFHNAGSDLYYAGSLLHRLSGKTEPLVWSKRLAYRYVETRNPATGIGGSQYTRPKVDRAQLQFGDDFKGHVVLEGTLCPSNPHGLLESVVRPRICQLLLGETLGSDGQQFIQWALEELTAWGKVAYCRKDNSFVPILTDGTSLEGYIYTKGGYFGREGTVVKSIPAGQLTFWTYTLAYRVTGEEFMWEMARSIARGNNLGDLGVSSEDEPELEIITKCSDPYALLGFLELYKETGKKAFLDIATRIGDNILAERFHNGFFVPSKQALYTKFDYIEPLVLLHLKAVVNARPSSVPRVWPSRSFFACPYDAHERQEDTFVIYGWTEATDLTRLLHEAAWNGKIDEVKSLFSKGANVNAGTTVDYLTVQRILRISNALDTAQIVALTGTTTALHYAAQRGHMDVADWLIAKGADVNAINSAGETPLHYAAKAGHKNIVELLVAKGADVNAKNDEGQTPADVALLSRRRNEVVKLLITKGAYVSSIHLAAYLGEAAKVMNFIEQGSDVNTKDQGEDTPLHYAAMAGSKEVSELLLTRGADINAKGKDGAKPLHWGSSEGHRDLVELLITEGADIDARDDTWGETALHWAANSGQKAVVELLIAKGADIHVKDKSGHTPLYWAVDKGHRDVAELLIAKGADVNAKGNKGKTALSLAKEKGHKEIVELLRKHGAKE